MTMIQIDLPDATAKAARAAGLLTPAALEKLLTEAIRRQAMDRFLAVAPALEKAGAPPITEDEIQAEVQAFRAERSTRETAASPFDAVWNNPEDDIYNAR